MRLEMLGPPTAGKTTIWRGLRARGLLIGRWDESARPSPNDAFAARVRETYALEPYEKLPDKTLSALVAAKKADKNKQLVVFDELVVQCGLSLAIRIKSDWTWYFHEMPLPKHLLVLDAPVEELLKRNLARGAKNRAEKTLRAVGMMPIIRTLLVNRSVPLIEYDTSRVSPQQIVDEVAKRCA